MSFKQRMEDSVKKAKSNIVLALDFAPEDPNRILSRSIRTLESVHAHLCALKLNRQAVLPLGLFDGVQKIIRRAHDFSLPTIMDAKINDIGNTNKAIAEYYFKAGFDAIIASPFVGWEEGLQPVFEVAKKLNRGVIILVYMSHKAAIEGYGQMVKDPETKNLTPQYRVFAEKALRWKADGAVVGATYPDKICEVKLVLNAKVPIYSPGVGAQGGDVTTAVEAGTSYLIVGRAIAEAEDPGGAARRIKEIAWQSLERERQKRVSGTSV